MPSKVKIIPKEKLMKLHTGSLINRRKQLLQCEESFTLSDRFGYENGPDPKETGYIEFKDTEDWENAYKELREILKNREHRDRK
jgi:hypothetical protein